MAGPREEGRETRAQGGVAATSYARRRSERILLSIPIQIDGATPSGQRFSETTRTLVINRHGARIIMKHRVEPGAKIKVQNLAARREADFRVVGPTGPATEEGGEWGVECGDEKANIWGIEFPPTVQDDSRGSALLECRTCHRNVVTAISLVELDVLMSSGLLTRECDVCGHPTAWSYAEQPRTLAPGTGEARLDASEATGAPQRFYKRAALRLPIQVRDYYGGAELTKSENVSKSGLCFTSEKKYEIGSGILVTCPYDPRGNNIEVRARIVRRQQVPGSSRIIYGVSYEQMTPASP
jgi:PilZ domain-containing protein